MNIEENHPDFDKLMAKSKLDLPFTDFEDVVMQQIAEKAIQKSSTSKALKLSRFFFIVGSVFGIAISILISELQAPLLGLNSNVIALIFQITFATLFFTQIEHYFTFKKRL
ncbi:hypothetical protein GCM10011416_16070 [Polaribacter pacificus]|uniref:Uncharacterized protein n=1 Tax=Polaribacter pacificus TaxID=1775173 RepID=A0A917HZZ7_9FLAO|nr:hypothetical protein [Polaribacter pacificus]GGG98651.1 hypothetical protein GCM10011416_16070 [Polaribacter pacificus]